MSIADLAQQLRSCITAEEVGGPGEQHGLRTTTLLAAAYNFRPRNMSEIVLSAEPFVREEGFHAHDYSIIIVTVHGQLFQVVLQSPIIQEGLNHVLAQNPMWDSRSADEKFVFTAPFFDLYVVWDKVDLILQHMHTQYDNATLAGLMRLPRMAHIACFQRDLSQMFAEAVRMGRIMEMSGVVDFNYLWAVLKPGTIVVGSLLGTDTACKIMQASYDHTAPFGGSYVMDCLYTNWDGTYVGHMVERHSIPFFQGVRNVSTLPWFPGGAAFEQRFEAQGRILESLFSPNMQVEFFGLAVDKHVNGNISRVPVHGRVVVDPMGFERNNPHRALALRPIGRPGMNISRADATIFFPFVRGYSLLQQRWLEFPINDITSVPGGYAHVHDMEGRISEADMEVIDAIIDYERAVVEHEETEVLPEEFEPETTMMILSGEAGTGKTSLAQLIADDMTVPLVALDQRDFLMETGELDEIKLAGMQEQARQWKAIVVFIHWDEHLLPGSFGAAHVHRLMEDTQTRIVCLATRITGHGGLDAVFDDDSYTRISLYDL